jgi:hypothetical protein
MNFKLSENVNKCVNRLIKANNLKITNVLEPWTVKDEVRLMILVFELKQAHFGRPADNELIEVIGRIKETQHFELLNR